MPAPSKNKHALATLRRVLGLGQKEVAALAGCSKSAIQRIELGRLPLSPSLAARLSAETGVHLDWLMAGQWRTHPVSITGKRLTLDFHHRHRAWKSSVRPATDAEWQRLEALMAQGFNVGLEWPGALLPDNPKARAKHLHSLEGFEPKLRLERDGKPVRLPREIKALERQLAKRIECDMRGSVRQAREWELLEQFLRLLRAASLHKDADLLLWRLRDVLAQFIRKQKLGDAPPLSTSDRKAYQDWIAVSGTGGSDSSVSTLEGG